VHNRHLTRLFLRRFIENDLISPDADRAHVLAHTCALLISGGLFVTIPLSLGYLTTPYALPYRTAVQVIRVQFLYASWSMTVMALVAVSAWDALALDSRDTVILGPLPLARSLILRAKVSALIMFAVGFAAALNLVPGMIHPVFAIARLRPSLLQVVTLIVAHLTSTTAAAAFGFLAVLGLRELLHGVLGAARFRRISVMVQAGLVVALVTTLLLIPAFSVRVSDQWLAHGAMETNLLPPMWFVGLHDLMSGHIWTALARPDLPPRVLASERAFEELYRNRRPLLFQLGVAGGGTFLLVLFVSAVAYLWNNRRLPDPPSSGRDTRRSTSVIINAIAQRLLAQQPSMQAGFFFTLRVLARSVPNRLAIGVPFAVAIAIATTVSLRFVGTSASVDLSEAPISLLAVQMLLVVALVGGFRHSIRVPADLRARWLFHLVRPANQRGYVAGVKWAALVKLVLPVLIALLPLHMLAFGRPTAVLHFVYGFLGAIVLNDAFLLGFPRLPFASSYVPATTTTTYSAIVGLIYLVGVYTSAWIERVALSTTRGTIVLFAIMGMILVVIRGADAWQRRDRGEAELDELVDPPTLRLGLME